ncbi:MAG: CHAT domain-containing protein [Lewinellaceae bacterium]|nr:CHAT domain-containing protein [Lewinellaceae bacterium]
MKKVFPSFGLLFAFCSSGFGQVDTAAVVREVDSLIEVSRKLTGERNYEEALKVNEQAIELTLEKHDAFQLCLANCQFNKGRIYHFMASYKEAEYYYLEAKDIKEKLLGKSLKYADILHNLSILYLNMGQYESAITCNAEVLQIREFFLGKEDINYANSLNFLGVLYMDTGQYAAAEPAYLESNRIREKLLGKEHPQYGQGLLNLANLYVYSGRLENAESLYLENLSILKQALGEENTDYGLALNNLASLYRNMGKYEASESLYLRARANKAKTVGKEHPDYAQTTGNLATLYLDLGNFEEAEKLYLEAITIYEKAMPASVIDYAANLNNLANLYMDVGRFEDSEIFHLKSKEIREAILGKEHPEYASSLNNLANLYKALKQYEIAEKLQLEAKAIWEKALGEEHPRSIMVRHNLGVLYHQMGKYSLAKDNLSHAIKLWKNTLGELHLNYSNSLFCLANLEYSFHNYDAAEPVFRACNIIDWKLLVNGTYYLSTGQLFSFSQGFSSYLNTYFSFFKTQPSSFDICYDNALFYKGFLLTSASQINKLALTDSLSTEKYNLLKSYHRRLASEYSLPISDRDSTLVAELETKANDTEKDLARTVAGFGEALRQVSWQEIQAALLPGEATIEFVRFDYYKPEPTDSVLYAALLLKPGMESPAFLPLFEEKQLEALLEPLAGLGSDGWNELYAGKAGESLHQLLWGPLEAPLEGVKTVYFSPAGLLHRLNLGAIPTGKNTTLSDRFELVAMGSTRQLVVNSSQAVGSAETAVIFGGIQYEMDSTAIAPAEPDGLASRHRGPSFSQTDSTLRGGTWKYLKYSNKEADNIQSLLQTAGFQAEVRKGYAATEEAFKLLGRGRPSPRILHVSTHGFFFTEAPLAPEGANSPPPGGAGGGFKSSGHPMIRSGLILAGANHAWQMGQPLGNREDGILTAYEISQMDLRHTELVVLSACETGLGDIKGNEGVYGLQRAFKIAGAKYLIMSLWQVPDFQTQELMTVFYQKWLEGKMTVRQALKAAQEEMRQKRYEPFYWAGFVLVE